MASGRSKWVSRQIVVRNPFARVLRRLHRFLPVAGLPDTLFPLSGQLRVGHRLEDHVRSGAGVPLAPVPHSRENCGLRSMALGAVRLRRRAGLTRNHRLLVRSHHAMHAGPLPDDLQGSKCI